LLEKWARFGNPDEMRRICKDILERPRQGYPIAYDAWGIIRAHVEHWRLDVPVERKGSRENRALLKSGEKVVRRLDDGLRDMIDLHRQAEKRRWYGKEILGGEIEGPAARSWARYPDLYERVRKALDADPLCRTLRDTPPDMWLIPPAGNPANRRNGALMKALSGIGLTKLQVDDVIQALGDWTRR
jgi:hypothetical protein